MMTYILLYLLTGFVTWTVDMARSRPSHPILWIVALLIHLILGPVIAAVAIANGTLAATGFVAGTIAAAFMRGFNKGYDR